MNAFSILRDAWYFYHRHVTSLALLCLPLLLLESLTRHLLSPHLGEWQGSADLLAGLVFYPVYGAALILYLDTRTRGLTPGAAQLLAMALRLWPALALLTAVSSLLILLGASLFILPGLWLMVRLAFADFLLVLQGFSPRGALSDSMALTRGQFWRIFSILMLVMVPLWILDAWLFGLLPEGSLLPRIVLDGLIGFLQLFSGVALYRCFMLTIDGPIADTP